MLYKYVSVNSKSYFSILEKYEVYFASVKSLNDPFEGTPYYSLPSRNELKQYLISKGIKRGRFKDQLVNVRKALENNQEVLNAEKGWAEGAGVLCLTPNSNNLLMWSHYGNEHKGVCLGFDVARPFDPVFGNGYEVEYSSAYPKICVTQMNDLFLETKKGCRNIERFDDVTTKQFFTKAECWRYEEEVRFLRPVQTYGVGTMAFPPFKLKEVILGCKITQEDRDQTINLAKKNFPEAKIFQMEMDSMYYSLNPLELVG